MNLSTSVKNGHLHSPLMNALTLKPSRKRMKKKAVMALILTSLVDAFSIMLLYLLTVNTGNGSTATLNQTEHLPTATRVEALEAGTLVRVKDGVYYIGDGSGRSEALDVTQLAARLQRLASQSQGLSAVADPSAHSLIIQADRNMDFAMLTPVIRAGSVSGYSKFKFAVLQDESSAKGNL